jgi:hypothetical protein
MILFFQQQRRYNDEFHIAKLDKIIEMTADL